MALLKDGRIQRESWVYADASADPADRVIVDLETWRVVRESWRSRNEPVGIRLASHEDPAEIADDVARFDVIALEFPKFTDGRAYSSARLLRERYGYRGELRAVGTVLRDQYAFMRRVGFDAFEIGDDEDVGAWRAAEAAIADVYQPAADARQPVHRLRQGQRPAARAPAGRQTPSHSAIPRRAAAEPIAAHWAY